MSNQFWTLPNYSNLFHSSVAVDQAKDSVSPVHQFPEADEPKPKRCKSDAVLSDRELIAQNAQSIVDDLNNKRKQDAQMMKDFKKALEEHVRFFHYIVSSVVTNSAPCKNCTRNCYNNWTWCS